MRQNGAGKHIRNISHLVVSRVNTTLRRVKPVLVAQSIMSNGCCVIVWIGLSISDLRRLGASAMAEQPEGL